jgi:hypothetical protein
MFEDVEYKICITKKIFLLSNESDGPFHQYQQNEQLPLILTHWTQKRQWYITLEISTLGQNIPRDSDNSSDFDVWVLPNFSGR